MIQQAEDSGPALVSSLLLAHRYQTVDMGLLNGGKRVELEKIRNVSHGTSKAVPGTSARTIFNHKIWNTGRGV